MKWVIAEKVVEPDQSIENEDGDLIPYVHWVRRAEEFPTRSAANDWITQQTGKPVLQQSQFDPRRLEDAILTPKEIVTAGSATALNQAHATVIATMLGRTGAVAEGVQPCPACSGVGTVLVSQAGTTGQG